jgi:hypothetical protein
MSSLSIKKSSFIGKRQSHTMKKNGNNPAKGKPIEGRTTSKAKNKIKNEKVD